MDSNTMTKAILDMSSSLGRVEAITSATKDKVDSHDELLQGHTKLLTTIDNRTVGMDSWKNGIIALVAKEADARLATIRSEVKPLHDDYNLRKENTKDGVKRTKDFLWGLGEKVLYIVIGGSITAWIAIKNFLIK